ncbi:hypothetical protein N665_1006s0015 [Sinapis alba]|nr:hypothetical protein N665_1006s0015 [Sinapis alba]
MPVALVLLLALTSLVQSHGAGNVCDLGRRPNTRPHSVSILEFGAVGDGKTLNTIAFQNAVFYLKSFADKGGAQLYVPPGRWLTGSFNLTSHLTLFLEKDAVILASQVFVTQIGLDAWTIDIAHPEGVSFSETTWCLGTARNKTVSHSQQLKQNTLPWEVAALNCSGCDKCLWTMVLFLIPC